MQRLIEKGYLVGVKEGLDWNAGLAGEKDPGLIKRQQTDSTGGREKQTTRGSIQATTTELAIYYAFDRPTHSWRHSHEG